jgi:hypothetical protein
MLAILESVDAAKVPEILDQKFPRLELKLISFLNGWIITIWLI